MLTQQYWRTQARRDRGVAMVVQILLNVHRGEYQSPWALEEVMLALGHRPEAPPPPPPTVEELQDRFALLSEVFSKNGAVEG